MRGTAALAIALWAMTGSVAAARQIDPVYIRTQFGVEGNGARFVVGDRCVTVTAWHVIAGSNQPDIVPIRTQSDQAQVEKREQKLDIGLAVQNSASARSCTPLPSAAQIEKALTGSRRELWHVNANGEPRIFSVRLVSFTPSSIKLAMLSDSADLDSPIAFTPGMSGSLVVFNDVPVGILQSTETVAPIATAQRLDFIIKQFPSIFEPAVVDSRPAIVWKEFQLEQLPLEYQAIVRQARETRARATALASKADQVQRKAEDASALARKNPKDFPVRRLAHFDAKNTGNYYAGEIYEVGVDYGSEGYGISEVLKDPHTGDRYFCRFVRGVGCSGPGVVEYADNLGNDWKGLKWRGGLQSTVRVGLGHLIWREGSEAWYNAGQALPQPGVWITADGIRFEGLIGESWDGKGVLWTKEGKVQAIGDWKNGELVTDETARLTGRTQNVAQQP